MGIPYKSYKYYASKYGISILTNGRHKSVNELSLDIYEYERKHQPNDPLFPYIKIRIK